MMVGPFFFVGCVTPAAELIGYGLQTVQGDGSVFGGIMYRHTESILEIVLRLAVSAVALVWTDRITSWFPLQRDSVDGAATDFK